LEGLEITVLKFSIFIEDNIDFRLDAEYFSKENNTLLNFIHRKGYRKISDFAYVTDGIHTSIDYSNDSGINLISATSPKENIFNLSRQAFITLKSHNENPRTALKENDIILSTVGTIGNCAVVTKSILPANSDRHVGIIRVDKTISPFYISTFLLSKFGKFQTLRESTGNVQLNLFIYKIKTLKIANLSIDFQNQIEKLIKQAHSNLDQSQSLYAAAEQNLLEILGIANWQPTEENTSIKTFSNSFGTSGRLDAEYYQPKYDEIEEKIKTCEFGWCLVNDKYKLNESVCGREKEYYNYIEIGDINIGSGDYSYTKLDTNELPANARINLQQGDLLVSNVRPYRGAIAIINEEIPNLVGSGAFTVLQEKSDFLNEYLSILLRTSIYKELMMKFNVGSSYPVIKDEDILNLPIPILPMDKQKELSAQIQESFKNRQESSRLIEIAKQAVEMAIEQDEETAMKFIKENT
jgi:restriction endonuclease S subunit